MQTDQPGVYHDVQVRPSAGPYCTLPGPRSSVCIPVFQETTCHDLPGNIEAPSHDRRHREHNGEDSADTAPVLPFAADSRCIPPAALQCIQGGQHPGGRYRAEPRYLGVHEGARFSARQQTRNQAHLSKEGGERFHRQEAGRPHRDRGIR